MDYRSYIKECIQNNDEEELLLSWNYLGKQEATNTTRVYIKDQLYIINDANSKYNGYAIWCKASYSNQINWSKLTINGDEIPYTVVEGGVSTHCFEFLNYQTNKSKLDAILLENPNHSPFVKYNGNTETTDSTIVISDSDYYRITKVIGQPFLKDSELEYSREAIIRLSIEPAIKTYYKWYPIEREEVYPISGAFDILIPDMAFNAASWTNKGGYGGMPYTPSSVLNGYIGLSTTKDVGITYNKPVPGYTGRSTGESRVNTYLDNATLINTLRTLGARERSNVLRKEDGLHLVGYSNMTSNLNICWMCWSKYFDDVAFEDYEDVIRFCQASVMADFGAIRNLLRTDNNIPMDAQRLIQTGEDQRNKILEQWKTSPWRMRYAIERGGWMPGGN